MDPHCGWCFANSNNINEVVYQLNDSLQFEIIVGGMLIGQDAPYGGSVFSQFLSEHAPSMANAIGVELNPKYYELAMDSTYQFSSLEPCAAIVLIKQMAPQKSFQFAGEVQKSMFVKGKKLNDLATYIPILNQLNIDVTEFTNQWLKKDNLKNTYDEFELASSLTNDYPSLLLQKDNKTFMLAPGYLEKEEILELLKP